MRERQGAEEHCIYNAEDGSAGANTKSQGENRDESEGRILPQHAETEAHVLPKAMHCLIPRM